MKKKLAVILAFLLLFAGCSAKPQESPSTEPAETEKAPAAEEPEAEAEGPEAESATGNPEKFEGAYIQEDADSKETFMEAVVEGDTITVNWNMNGGETIALYWAGTFEQPQGRAEYTFDSVNDTEKTQYALLASHDETKPITVNGGKISFSVTAMGATTTVHMIPGAEG